MRKAETDNIYDLDEGTKSAEEEETGETGDKEPSEMNFDDALDAIDESSTMFYSRKQFKLVDIDFPETLVKA